MKLLEMQGQDSMTPERPGERDALNIFTVNGNFFGCVEAQHENYLYSMFPFVQASFIQLFNLPRSSKQNIPGQDIL